VEAVVSRRAREPGGRDLGLVDVQGACGVADPETLEPFAADFSTEQIAMFERYLATAERLVSTAVLKDGGSLKSI
jgi:hypothetical protein